MRKNKGKDTYTVYVFKTSECSNLVTMTSSSRDELLFHAHRSINYCNAWLSNEVRWRHIYLPRLTNRQFLGDRTLGGYLGYQINNREQGVDYYQSYLTLMKAYRHTPRRYPQGLVYVNRRMCELVLKFQDLFNSEQKSIHEYKLGDSGWKESWSRYFQNTVLPQLRLQYFRDWPASNESCTTTPPPSPPSFASPPPSPPRLIRETTGIAYGCSNMNIKPDISSEEEGECSDVDDLNTSASSVLNAIGF